jgi:hypothetical protein
MFQTGDPGRVEAFAKLLASPQPADLPRGGQVRRWDGDPDRRATRLPAMIMAWLQYRHLEVDAEEPLDSRVRIYVRPPRLLRRVNPGLHVLKPTGT